MSAISKKKWTEGQLRIAVRESGSVRQVIQKLGLVEAGGNYDQMKRWIAALNLDTSHFHGRAWNKGLSRAPRYKQELSHVLQEGIQYQSFKLKKRLVSAGLKKESCELCGWAQKSADGRIPVELDHVNGNKYDNRLENLRILCPNCHSLQMTHRGKNKKAR